MSEYAISGGRASGKTMKLLEKACRFAEGDFNVLYVAPSYVRALNAKRTASQFALYRGNIVFTAFGLLPGNVKDYPVILIDDAQDIEFVEVIALVKEVHPEVLVIAGIPQPEVLRDLPHWFTGYLLSQMWYGRAEVLPPNPALTDRRSEIYTTEIDFRRDILGELT